MRAHHIRPDPVGTGRPATGRRADRRSAQPRSASRAPRGHRSRVPRPRRRPPRQGRAGPPDQPRPSDGLIRVRAAGACGGGRPARPGGASSCTRRSALAGHGGPAARTPVGCPATPRSVHDVATPTSRCTVWWAAPVDPESAPELVGPARRARARPARPLPSPGRPGALPRGARARPARPRPARGDGGRRPRLRPHLPLRRAARQARPPGGPGFSLSHAGDLVGVAVRPDGPVGLDVEQLRDIADLDALAGHVRSPAERSRPGLDHRRVLPHLDAQGGPASRPPATGWRRP